MSDTIFAPASGSGRAGVSVWRLSGEGSAAAVITLTGRPLPDPRRAVRVRVADHLGEVIDDGLLLWFPAPHSFTGEDVAELHLHGGRAVALALAETLRRQGLRPAEPGEFSRRAFLNGKMDLTRAEAVADLVEAETTEQRRQARRQLDGGLADLVEGWRAELIRVMAHLEAVIDFADEDIPDGLAERSRREAMALRRDMEARLDDRRMGERLRDGIHIAILGAPNAGKSSLLNRLAGREAAIVSAQAGTTRDVIEVHLDLGGRPVIIADTAGLRETECEIEGEGVRRAQARAAQADLRLCVFDAGLYPNLDAATLEMIDDAGLVVLNKSDVANRILPAEIAGRPALALCALSGEGVDELVTVLERTVESRFAGGTVPVLTRARHRAAVAEAVAALGRFDPEAGLEIAAEDVRLAARALGRITGRVDVDEVLDVIFGEFCIGK